MIQSPDVLKSIMGFVTKQKPQYNNLPALTTKAKLWTACGSLSYLLDLNWLVCDFRCISCRLCSYCASQADPKAWTPFALFLESIKKDVVERVSTTAIRALVVKCTFFVLACLAVIMMFRTSAVEWPSVDVCKCDHQPNIEKEICLLTIFVVVGVVDQRCRSRLINVAVT